MEGDDDLIFRVDTGDAHSVMSDRYSEASHTSYNPTASKNNNKNFNNNNNNNNNNINANKDEFVEVKFSAVRSPPLVFIIILLLILNIVEVWIR